MNEINDNRGRPVCRGLREKMGYSIGEMALILGLKKSTYQGYDQGTRTPPDSVVSACIEAYQREIVFWDRYKPGGEFDRKLSEEYPNGIRSECQP